MDPTHQQFEQTVEQAQANAGLAGSLPLDEKPIDVTIIIPTQAYFLSGIRDFVVNLTKNLTGFSAQWAFRFQAVVDELCNNAIEHGSAVGGHIKVTLISTKNKSLEVWVEDTGTGKEKLTAEQLSTLYQERRQLMATQYLGFRGRGLPKIVGEWTDEVIFENIPTGGIKVKVKKYLRKEEDTVLSSPQKDSTHIVLQ
ncbi:MAG: ATP-binding protein [Candidatus Gracilibacteria bacterium]